MIKRRVYWLTWFLEWFNLQGLPPLPKSTNLRFPLNTLWFTFDLWTKLSWTKDFSSLWVYARSYGSNSLHLNMSIRHDFTLSSTHHRYLKRTLVYHMSSCYYQTRHISCTDWACWIIKHNIDTSQAPMPHMCESRTQTHDKYKNNILPYHRR